MFSSDGIKPPYGDIRKLFWGRILGMIFLAHHLIFGALIVFESPETAFMFILLSTSGFWALLAVAAGCAATTKGVLIWHFREVPENTPAPGPTAAQLYAARCTRLLTYLTIGQGATGAVLLSSDIYPAFGAWCVIGALASLGYLLSFGLAIPAQNRSRKAQRDLDTARRNTPRARRRERKDLTGEAVFAGMLLTLVTHKLLLGLIGAASPQGALATVLYFGTAIVVFLAGAFGWFRHRRHRTPEF